MRTLLASLIVAGMVTTWTHAFADTSVGIDGNEWQVSIPSLALVGVNGIMIAAGAPSKVVGALGAVFGLFTGIIGIAAHEPIMIASGSASVLAGAIAVHRSDQRDARLSLGPDLSAGSPGLVLSLRF